MRLAWGWWLLLLLGAYHGLNPGMGWLFAVALGMQEHSGESGSASAGAHRPRPCAVHRLWCCAGAVSSQIALPLGYVRYRGGGRAYFAWASCDSCGVGILPGAECRWAFET